MDAGVGISCFIAFFLVFPVCILFAKFVLGSKTANETANETAKVYFLILLYFTLLALLSSVFKIAFSSTNSANRRDTLALSFSGKFSNCRASELFIVSMESK